MQVGNKIYLFRNVNLKFKIPIRNGKLGSSLKDPSKGIVHSRLEGEIVRILQDGEVLSHQEIMDYCNGNRLMEKSFDFNNRTAGERIVAKFPQSRVGRFRMLSEHKFNANDKTMTGYARCVPNSIHFIREDL